MRAIVSTRPDGAVSITRPTSPCFKMLTHGGAPVAMFARRASRDWEIEKHLKSDAWHPSLPQSVRERLAARWVDGLMLGGLTDAEAYGLVRDRDTDDDWTGKELWDADEVPADRWYRDAWRRSHNGGPISIELRFARAVQYSRIRSAAHNEDARRAADPDAFGAAPIELTPYVHAVRSARDLDELRKIWPKGFATCSV